jgi:hypothetical protein
MSAPSADVVHHGQRRHHPGKRAQDAVGAHSVYASHEAREVHRREGIRRRFEPQSLRDSPINAVVFKNVSLNGNHALEDGPKKKELLTVKSVGFSVKLALSHESAPNQLVDLAADQNWTASDARAQLPPTRKTM